MGELRKLHTIEQQRTLQAQVRRAETDHLCARQRPRQLTNGQIRLAFSEKAHNVVKSFCVAIETHLHAELFGDVAGYGDIESGELAGAFFEERRLVDAEYRDHQLSPFDDAC